MIRQVEKIFDLQIRPVLAQHGGNVEIIDIDNNKLFVKLTGGCQGCAASRATLKQGIEKIILQKFPELEEVVDLTDHQSGENPYM
ncbi:MAG: NifU family protein [Halobacteriovoraceae bacterium]|nr:NifU family protein [Halobacteriovoraceae bacterium]